MKKIMIDLSGGGHTEQMIRIIDQIGKDLEYIYLIMDDDKVSQHRIKINGKIHKVKRAVVPYRSKLNKIFTLTINFFQSLFLYLKERPDAIISSGPGTAIPISFIGKIFGSKIIFIESWSRVKTPSTSGKIIYNFADLFFVQWQNLQKRYPKARFVGRVA